MRNLTPRASLPLFAAVVQLVFCFASARAQEGQTIVLPKGAAINVTLAKDLSSKDATRGDEVQFTVAEDVKVDGQTLIAKGTSAKGTVIYAKQGGYLGKSGKLAVQVDSTTTRDGKVLPLRAAKGGEGESKTGTALALSFIPGPFGITTKGGETTFKTGMPITVYSAETRRFRVEGASLVAVEDTTPASTEAATVYFYRTKKMVGAALEPSVFADHVELARMDNGRWFMIKLPPGKHLIHLTEDEKGYELNIAPAQTYYFRIGLEAGMWKGHGKILLEANDKGAADVKELKPLGADKIKAKDRVLTGVDPAPSK